MIACITATEYTVKNDMHSLQVGDLTEDTLLASVWIPVIRLPKTRSTALIGEVIFTSTYICWSDDLERFGCKGIP